MTVKTRMPIAISNRRSSSHHGDRVGAGSFSRPVRPLGVVSSGTRASVDHSAVDDDLLLRLSVDLARRADRDEAEVVALDGDLGVGGTAQGAAQATVGVGALLVLH